MRTFFHLLFVLSVFAVSAAGQCTFSISPTSQNFPTSGGNDIITITQTSGTVCARTATSNAQWITISFGSPGTGNGTVGFTVQSNNFTVVRTGTITVAGQTFTVTQAAANCSYTLSPSSASVAAGGASGSFNLQTNSSTCAWTVQSNNSDWLTVSSAASGSGSTTINYTAAANASTGARTGTISVGTSTFTVTQPGQCAFTLNPSAVNVATTGATGTVAVTASSSSCGWTATSNNTDWLTVTSGSSGTGNGSVGYSAAANATLQDRAGSISIGTAGFSVFQPGSSCNFAFSSTSQSFPASGGIGSFFVNSGCPWTATTTNPDWIVITSGSSTTGAGSVSFAVAGNTGTQPRTGSIQVGNGGFTINEAGVPCAVTLSSNTGSSVASGSVGTISVTAGDGCSWTASTTAGWVTLAGVSGSGNGDVTYTTAANTTPQQRVATITIANQKFVLTQDAAQCDYQLTPGQATVGAAGGSGSFDIATSCSWSATTASNWISLPKGATGTGAATLSYSVQANPTSDARTGTIKLAGQSFTIAQTGKNCSFTISPASAVIPGRGGSATLQVTGAKGCTWTPVKDQDWLTIPTWSNIDGKGSVTVSATANSAVDPRSATLSAGGQAVIVTQGGLEVILTSAAGVVNAASFASGPVAPGEIITMYGQGIGPVVAATLQSDGTHVLSTLANTQVLFDGVPAPLVYVSDQQVSAVVPYAIAGKPTTELKVVNQGVVSNPLTLTTAAAIPAIFTLDASGKGAGAVLNQDGSVNSAANPAARGTIVQIFGTGEGQTNPAGEDGKVALGPVLPKPVQPVTVTIGGQTAPVIYAGAAPSAVAGLLQVNARIAANAATGAAVPVVVRVGQAQSPAGVTIAVK